MASLSMSAVLPASMHSPFDSSPTLSPPRTSAHLRKHSRNPTAPPLPAFSFNPGASSQPTVEDQETAGAILEAMPAQEAPKKASPLPLPDFKFNPGADTEQERSTSPTHPILEEMAQSQHRNSRSARPSPLPAFNFGPAGSTGQLTPSPTKSSFSDGTGPLRAGVHRRHGSEFVGGGNDGSQLISTSPEKGEVRPHGPPVSGYTPRGHIHRRSQAISISDIDTSDLIKANAISKHRAGSTPTTPSEQPHSLLFSRGSPQTRQSISYTTTSPSATPRRRGSAPGVRPRVGFAEQVDVIPRPLSLISSETEGSTSTIRGNHSVTGSMNSIATSPTPRLTSMLSFDDGSPQQRPQTADAVVLNTGSTSEKAELLHSLNLPKRPLSASGSPAFTTSGSPPTKKKFWFNHSNECSPMPSPIAEQSDPFSSVSGFVPSEAIDVVRPKTSPERSASIKKRKVRTWTNGIFSRKARPRSTKTKAKRIPTPPLLTRRASDHLNQIFDADDTIVIRDPSPISRETSAHMQATRNTDLLPAKLYEPEDHLTSPIIDLDAALGPFGSEEKLSGDFGSRNAASRMSKLHSSERRGVPDAFGNFHRRAESAPQMPPVNRGAFGMHRLGSNTSLVGDVFDEEEEDNFLAGELDAGRVSATSLDELRTDGKAVTPEPQEDTVGAVAESGCQTSVDGLGLALSQPSPDSVVIVDPDDTVGLNATRASNSTIEAPMLSGPVFEKSPVSPPMEFAYPAPQTHYASSTEGPTATNSLISSPDADHVSFDHQPRFTRFLSEPTPDVGLRSSTDDLPSLTDSISTGAIARFSSSANTRSSVEQRSASLSTPVVSKPDNVWKRASLASLNRLIPGSSNGSRLKLEVMPDPPEAERGKKKINRISKLMHFWRSKEKSGK